MSGCYDCTLVFKVRIIIISSSYASRVLECVSLDNLFSGLQPMFVTTVGVILYRTVAVPLSPLRAVGRVRGLLTG